MLPIHKQLETLEFYLETEYREQVSYLFGCALYRSVQVLGTVLTIEGDSVRQLYEETK